jgi:hypothetical protein
MVIVRLLLGENHRLWQAVKANPPRLKTTPVRKAKSLAAYLNALVVGGILMT